MRTLIIATHRPEEYEAILPLKEDYFIETNDDKRLIAIKNTTNSQMPSLTFEDKEQVLLLFHGTDDYINEEYGSEVDMLISYDCGTSSEPTKRKMYELILSKKMNVFEEVWAYFNEFKLEAKLNFLHAIYDGKEDIKIPDEISSDAKTFFQKHFFDAENKKIIVYDKSNPKMRENLKTLRDSF